MNHPGKGSLAARSPRPDRLEVGRAPWPPWMAARNVRFAHRQGAIPGPAPWGGTEGARCAPRRGGQGEWPRPGPWCGGRGFSFTEIAIALLVLAVAVVPVFLSFRQGTTGTIQTRDEVAAYALAADVLSYLQGKGFDLVDGQPASALVAEAAAARVLPPDPRFTPTLTVTEVPPPAPNVPFQYKILVVGVAWTSGGVSRSVKMSGLLFRASP